MSAARAAGGDAPFLNREALLHLNERRVSFLVGGALGCQAHIGTHGTNTGVAHLELFVREADRHRVLDLLREIGWEVIGDVSHWLTKARRGDAVIDVIHGSANGIAQVDDLWFGHSVPGQVLDVETRLVPVEEMIWSKAFAMDKGRFEGADVAHLLLMQAGSISWDRLLWRFGRHWRVLLGHLMFFGYVYPERRNLVPQTLVDTLLVLLRHEHDESAAGRRMAQRTSRPAEGRSSRAISTAWTSTSGASATRASSRAEARSRARSREGLRRANARRRPVPEPGSAAAQDRQAMEGRTGRRSSPGAALLQGRPRRLHRPLSTGGRTEQSRAPHGTG